MSAKKLQLLGSLGSKIYVQDEMPTDVADGSVWIDTDETGSGAYVYVQEDEPENAEVGTMWLDTDEESDFSSGNASIYVQDEEPTEAVTGTMWLDTDEEAVATEGKQEIFIVNYDINTETVDHTPSEILAAYNEGKLPVLCISQGSTIGETAQFVVAMESFAMFLFTIPEVSTYRSAAITVNEDCTCNVDEFEMENPNFLVVTSADGTTASHSQSQILEAIQNGKTPIFLASGALWKFSGINDNFAIFEISLIYAGIYGIMTIDKNKVVTVTEGEFIPSFNLTEMGLPTIPMDGTEVSVSVDCTAFRTALDAGFVKLTAACDYNGATINVTHNVSGMYDDYFDNYAISFTSAIQISGNYTLYQCNIFVLNTGIQATIFPMQKETTIPTLTEHLASESMVLSSLQYGDELPEAGTVGRIFFKKVTE